MKCILMTIAMAALLTACGHRTSQANSDADSTSVDSIQVVDSLKTDSIGLQHEDSTVSVMLHIEWPTAGSEELIASVRHYICQELATSPNQEEKIKAVETEDGQLALKPTFQRYLKGLNQMWREALEGGYAEGMTFSYYLNIFKLADTERYVTYLTNSEGFYGGAHGFATSTGLTFSKITNRPLGYHTEYNEKTEQFEVREQTLFSQPSSPKLAALIKEGVRSYFGSFDNSKPSDDELLSELIGVPDVNRIPLPSSPPVFTPDGLSFTYQQYEIAPYAAGMINFNIAYDKVLPYLTPEAAELVVE